ncbi:MAG: hypothetical protein ACI91Z_000545 [Yoonia sp.]
MSVDGPLLPFVTTSKCCGAARQSGHSLQRQNLQGANSQTADKVSIHRNETNGSLPPFSD